jgi:hypothetical protein
MVGTHGKGKIILFCLFLLFVNCKKKPIDNKVKQNKYTYTGLKEGDLVCRLGDGFFSNYFREYASKEKIYSHIGLIAIEKNVPCVYHSEASELTGVGGIKKETLVEFLKGIDTYSFFRINLSKESCKKLIDHADFYLKKQVKFDLKLESDDEELYCSEFVATCINKTAKKEIIKPKLKYRNRFIYALDDIYLSKNVSKLNSY